jgi:hypothetical protein
MTPFQVISDIYHSNDISPYPEEKSPMSLQCPKCSSFQIGDRNHARKVAGTIGTVAGCVGGVTAVVHGAELGAIIGMALGPVGAALGGTVGALIGGFVVGGIAGGAAGAALGEVVDHTILDNEECLECGYTFSDPSRQNHS